MHSTILDKMNRNIKPHPLPQGNHEALLKLGERGSTEVQLS